MNDRKPGWDRWQFYIGVLVLAVGFAVAWGVNAARITHIEDRANKQDQIIEAIRDRQAAMMEAVGRVEAKLDTLLGKR